MSDNAIPAATLVVMRPAAPGRPEVLVVERAARMAFAGGMMVFPGGRVDPEDHALAAALGHSHEAAKVTAIRETLEETGVAVALGPVEPGPALELQAALHAGQPFAALVERDGLRPDLAALTPFARWMPAFKQPRQFDTLFYLAAAPAGEWPPHPQDGECVGAEWIAAAELLDRIERGEAGAIFPTKRNLERIARFPDLTAAVADARAHSLDTIVPWVEERDGEPFVCIPEGRGYPVTSEPLATAFRA